MKYLVILSTCIGLTITSFAQNADELRLQARTQLQQGDFDKAIATLNQARQVGAANIEVLKDLSFTYYLKRDFAAAIEVGKIMVERPDADAQAFQTLGLSYKATASVKEATKLYKTGIQRFPNSGVLYNEYGELLAADQKLDEAIAQWEKGIHVDPNYSSNYYNAAMYYNRGQNWLRTIVYAETFLNLESFSQRTKDMKPVLRDAYRRLLIPGVISQLQSGRNVSGFEKEILASYNTAVNAVKDTYTIEGLSELRKQFIADWTPKKQSQYAYRLFEHQQQLIADGVYEAYNYWLFSTGPEENAYQNWQAAHQKEDAGFRKWQENKVFKIPTGQYYFKS